MVDIGIDIQGAKYYINRYAFLAGQQILESHWGWMKPCIDCMASQLLINRYCAATGDTDDAAAADSASAAGECEKSNVPIVPIRQCQLSIGAFGTYMLLYQYFVLQMVFLVSTYISPIDPQSMLRCILCPNDVYSSHQMDTSTYLDKIQHHTSAIFCTTNYLWIHIQLYIFQSSPSFLHDGYCSPRCHKY